MRKTAALLLIGALASKAPAASQDPIIVTDDRPKIVIPLTQYDLTRAEEIRSIKHRISSAAMTVCDRSYRGMSYLEDVECVKTAKSAANSQLEAIVSKRGTGFVMTAITVGAPSK